MLGWTFRNPFLSQSDFLSPFPPWNSTNVFVSYLDLAFPLDYLSSSSAWHQTVLHLRTSNWSKMEVDKWLRIEANEKIGEVLNSSIMQLQKFKKFLPSVWLSVMCINVRKWKHTAKWKWFCFQIPLKATADINSTCIELRALIMQACPHSNAFIYLHMTHPPRLVFH